jgi:transposase
MATAEMGNLMGKNLFVFCGKRKLSIKLLYFDRSGFALWQKVLQNKKFFWPRKLNVEVVVFTTQQLEWLFEGFDVLKMRPFAELQFENVC